MYYSEFSKLPLFHGKKTDRFSKLTDYNDYLPLYVLKLVYILGLLDFYHQGIIGGHIRYSRY